MHIEIGLMLFVHSWVSFVFSILGVGTVLVSILLGIHDCL